MTESCPIPTPEQRKYMEIREAAERAMLDKVYKAIDDATAEVAAKFQEAVDAGARTDHSTIPRRTASECWAASASRSGA